MENELDMSQRALLQEKTSVVAKPKPVPRAFEMEDLSEVTGMKENLMSLAREEKQRELVSDQRNPKAFRQSLLNEFKQISSLFKEEPLTEDAILKKMLVQRCKQSDLATLR